MNYQFNYYFVGDRRKPIVLFLHGFMGSGEDFAVVANLLKSDFCCLLIDLPGHGHTEVSLDANYRMPELASAIVKLLTELSIKKCFLVGYSMGGRLALYLTLRFPQYFIKVVLESASPGLETKAARVNRIKQDLEVAKKLKNLDFALFLEQWYSNPLFISFKQHPNYNQAIAKRLKNDPHKLAKSLRYMGLGSQPSLWQELKTNQIPLLSIVGELDRKFIAIAEKIASLSTNSKLEIVKNTDHNVHFEQPLMYAEILNSFWQNEEENSLL